MFNALINLIETLLGLVFTPVIIIALGILFKNVKGGQLNLNTRKLKRQCIGVLNSAGLSELTSLNYAAVLAWLSSLNVSSIGSDSSSSWDTSRVTTCDTSYDTSTDSSDDTSDNTSESCEPNKSKLIRHLKSELKAERLKKIQLKDLVSKLDHKLREKTTALTKLSTKLNSQIKYDREDSVDSICAEPTPAEEKVRRLITLLKSEMQSKDRIENFVRGLTQIIEYDPSSYDCSSVDPCDIDYSAYLSCISNYAEKHSDLEERNDRLRKRLKNCACDCMSDDSVVIQPDNMDAKLLIKCQKLKSYGKWKKQIVKLIQDYNDTVHCECVDTETETDTGSCSSVECACESSSSSTKRTDYYERVNESIKTMMREMMKDMMDQKLQEKGIIDPDNSEDSDDSECDERRDERHSEEDLFALIAQLSRIMCECKESVKQHREDLELIVDSAKNDLKLYNAQIQKLNDRCCVSYPTEEIPEDPECIDINHAYDLVNNTSSVICGLLEYLSDCNDQLKLSKDHDMEVERYKHAYRECDRDRDAEKEAARLYCAKLKECRIERDCLLKDNNRLESDLRVMEMQLSAKDDYAKGLVNFLQTYLKSDSTFCKTENAELISIIKSDNEYNRDVLKSCLDNYDNMACKAVQVADEKHKMFKRTEKLVNSLVNKYGFKYTEITEAYEELCKNKDDTTTTSSDVVESCANKANKAKIIKLVDDCGRIKDDMEDRIKNLIKIHKCDDTCQMDDAELGIVMNSLAIDDKQHDAYAHGCDLNECYACYCRRIDSSCADTLDTSITGHNSESGTCGESGACGECSTCSTCDKCDSSSVSTCDHNKYSIVTSKIQNVENVSTGVGSTDCNDTSETLSITSVSEIEKCEHSSCRCKVHRRYCILLAKLKECQDKNVSLLIKVKHLKYELEELKKLKCIIPINAGQELETVEACFKYKPEYEIYFECYGYPKDLLDITKVDLTKIAMIRKGLANKGSADCSTSSSGNNSSSSADQCDKSSETNDWCCKSSETSEYCHKSSASSSTHECSSVSVTSVTIDSCGDSKRTSSSDSRSSTKRDMRDTCNTCDNSRSSSYTGTESTNRSSGGYESSSDANTTTQSKSSTSCTNSSGTTNTDDESDMEESCDAGSNDSMSEQDPSTYDSE